MRDQEAAKQKQNIMRDDDEGEMMQQQPDEDEGEMM